MVISLLALALLGQTGLPPLLTPSDAGPQGGDPAPYNGGQASSGSAPYNGGQAPSTSQGGEAHPPTKFRGALELTALSMPSGPPGGSMDVFVMGLPVLVLDSGEDFGFELGAELRLRVFDEPPFQKDEDIRGLLRGKDWDEASDFGQILRSLRVGSETGDAISLRAGRMERESLGHGHLVSRYNALLNPDYHPASARLSFYIGPTHTELFASDILGARIFAGEVALDIARTLALDESLKDRYHFAVSAAHDFGLAGYPSPSITLLHVDADARIYKNSSVRLSGVLGGGTRLFGTEPAVGAVAGLTANGEVGESLSISGRVEGRKQSGGFRQGMFGPAYELSRFSAVGFSGGPVANEQLPDSFSGYGELEVDYEPVDPDPKVRSGSVFGSVAAEYFAWGRLDGDFALTARFPGNKGAVTARFTALDALGRAPRFQGSGEFRYRFAPSFYVVATGGTVFFPQSTTSTLVRGVFGSIGLGADYER